MKIRYLLIVILTIQNISAFSQIFAKVDSLHLEFTNIIDGQWVDVNNDGFLEYVVLSKRADSVTFGMISIQDDMLKYRDFFSKKCTNASFNMIDFTYDGMLDVVLSTKSPTEDILEIYINNGSLNFQPNTITIDSIYTDEIIFADFTRNGTKEILSITENVNGLFEPRLYGYKKETMVWDTLSVQFSEGLMYQQLLNVDIDNDGWDDLFATGITSQGEGVLELYKNTQGKLKDEPHTIEYESSRRMSKADFHEDGDVDLVFYGSESNGASLHYYENENASFTKNNFGIKKDRTLQVFAADFNSDGYLDLILKSETSDTLKSELMINDGGMNFSVEEFPLADHQDFGDWDWDGDLDIIQFKQHKDSIIVILMDNITIEQNVGPANPTQASAFPFERSVMINWDSVLDDHTNQEAITYDLYIKEYKIKVSPGFYIDNPYRIVIAHGNQGTLTKAMYYDLEPGVYEYGIQTVDNAFYALGCAGGGSGSSSGGDILRGQFVICDSVLTHEHVVCAQEALMLISEDGKKGSWYSSVHGDLGVTDSLNVTIHGDEQIYFSVQNSTVCEDQEIWNFDVQEEGEIDLFPNITACKGDRLTFEAGEFWKSIQWSSSIKGELSDSSNLTYIVDHIDTINLNLESFQGCKFEDDFLINLSTPEISLSGEVYRIVKGNSVSIFATGGEQYTWSPENGLSNHLISNPIASPDKTTTYLVEVVDSIGCIVTGSVQIIVETSAFVPNLFTPNQDQKNDVLKIYGLEEVNDFTFKIYNRSGSLVYSSSDDNEVVTQGWDGTKNGKTQPNGVYYWKISGTYKNGNPVYLNGESSGAVHLLR